MNKAKAVLWRTLHVSTIIALVLALFPAPAGAVTYPVPAPRPQVYRVDSAAVAIPVKVEAADAPVLMDSTPSTNAPSAPPAPPALAPASPVVGPGGGVVRSADGRVVPSFPPGAVERSTTVTIAEQARDAKTPSHLFHVFTLQARDDLGADVERFARPVVASVILRPSDVEGIHGSPAIF